MRKVTVLFIIAATLLLSSCVIVPVPMAKKIEGPKGTIDNFDRGFMQTGLTNREEVDRKLASIDLGLKRQELFWGRFESSSAGVFAAAWLEPGAAMVNKSRVWGSNNMLISFDSAGVVTGSRVVPDRHIDKALVAWLAEHESPEQFPIRIKMRHYHPDTNFGEGELLIDEGGISFVESKIQAQVMQLNGKIRLEEVPNAELHKYEFDGSQLRRFFGGARAPKAGGGLYRIMVWQRPATKKSERKIWLYSEPMTPDDVLDMLSYMRKNCPAMKYDKPKG